MTDAQWQAGRPPLAEENQLAIACWNFAGGFDAGKLHEAAVYYGFDDIDLLMHLALLIRGMVNERERPEE